MDDLAAEKKEIISLKAKRDEYKRKREELGIVIGNIEEYINGYEAGMDARRKNYRRYLRRDLIISCIRVNHASGLE